MSEQFTISIYGQADCQSDDDARREIEAERNRLLEESGWLLRGIATAAGQRDSCLTLANVAASTVQVRESR